MSARKCTVCSARARKLQRAFVLALGKVRPGLVCASCARTGWLFVFGGDEPRASGSRRCAHANSEPARSMPEGTRSCLDCGAVFRKRVASDAARHWLGNE